MDISYFIDGYLPDDDDYGMDPQNARGNAEAGATSSEEIIFKGFGKSRAILEDLRIGPQINMRLLAEDQQISPEKDAENIVGLIRDNINLAQEHGAKMRAAQFFAQKINKAGKLEENFRSPEVFKAVREFCQKSRINVYVHSSYKVALCGNHPHFTFHVINKELFTARKLGSKGYILHLTQDKVKDIVAFLGKACDKLVEKLGTNNLPIIYLEHIPSANLRPSYLSAEQLHGLIRAVNKMVERRGYDLTFGLCLDTAHIWAMGQKIDSDDAMQNYLDQFEAVFGPKNILSSTGRKKGVGKGGKKRGVPFLIHLNDQLWPFNSGKDTHSPLAQGSIWASYRDNIKKSGLMPLALFAAKYGLDIILERGAKYKSSPDNKLAEDDNPLDNDYLMLASL